MIHILDGQTGILLGLLESFYLDFIDESVAGLKLLQFTERSSTKAVEHLKDLNRLLVLHERKGWQEFVIHRTDIDKDEVTVYAVGSETSLNGRKIISPATFEGWTLKQYDMLATSGTEFTSGYIEYGGSKTLVVDTHTRPFDFIQHVGKIFGTETAFRVEVRGNKVIGRYLDRYKRIGGGYKGKEFVNAKDIIGLKKTIYNDRILTGLHIIGPEREDGTRIEVTISNDEAFQRWNSFGLPIIKEFTPQNVDVNVTKEELIALGTPELEKRINSVVEFSITVVDLGPIFGHEATYLGDDVRIKDTEFNPPLYAEARIIRVRRPVKRGEDEMPLEKTYIIGEVVEFSEEEILKTFRQLQKLYGLRVIKSPRDIGAEPKIPQQPLVPLNPGIGDKWVDTSVNPVELKMYNGTTWDAVQGPKGDDGYTPVKGTDYFDGEDGQDATDGTSSYLWVRYSQNADGSAMTDVPTDALYIGIATTESVSAPTSYTAYTWSLIKGTDGVEGEPGKDGNTSYLHIKYSNDGGLTLTVNSGEDVGDWIGTYVDFTSADSTNVASYTWNKVKGEKGEIGPEGPEGSEGPMDTQLRTDLRMTAPLPSSIAMDENGFTAYQPDVTKFARMDYRGLYVQGGAIDIRTSAESNRGVIFDGLGIRGYNALGEKTFDINTDGNPIFKGDISGSTGTFSGKVLVVSGDLSTVIENGEITNSGVDRTLVVSDGSMILRSPGFLLNAYSKYSLLNATYHDTNPTTGVETYAQFGVESVNGLHNAHIETNNFFSARATQIRFEKNAVGETGSYFVFDKVEADGHSQIVGGKIKLKFLGGTTEALQVRDAADTGYREIWASNVTFGSKRESKKNISDYSIDALQQVKTTKVHEYHMNDDSDTEKKRLGLIYDEVPADIANISGEGVDAYAMSTMLWRAVQQLGEKIEVLEAL